MQVYSKQLFTHLLAESFNADMQPDHYQSLPEAPTSTTISTQSNPTLQISPNLEYPQASSLLPLSTNCSSSLNLPRSTTSPSTTPAPTRKPPQPNQPTTASLQTPNPPSIGHLVPGAPSSTPHLTCPSTTPSKILAERFLHTDSPIGGVSTGGFSLGDRFSSPPGRSSFGFRLFPPRLERLLLSSGSRVKMVFLLAAGLGAAPSRHSLDKSLPMVKLPCRKTGQQSFHGCKQHGDSGWFCFWRTPYIY